MLRSPPLPSEPLLALRSANQLQRDIEQYARHFSRDCILANVLGTTEVPNFRWYLVDKDTRISGGAVPVGYNYSDELKVILLDDDGEELGLNRTGQIAIKGRHLGPGYWKKPDLTRAVYLDDLDGGDERTYLTRDIGRMLPDGRLEHLGRKDSQVKVRGYRVDLSEIETVLLSLGMTREAVLVAQEDASAGRRLVAYVVPVRQPPPSVGEIRELLSETLPLYMVPSVFVFLEALPMLPGGKVDRLALPPPGAERPNLGNPLVAPRTPVEEGLAKIWAEVLRLDQVGVFDNFLELGGDSLKATKICIHGDEYVRSGVGVAGGIRYRLCR